VSDTLASAVAVQPHGALLAFRVSDLRVSQASVNCHALLGVAHAEVIGRSLHQTFDDASVAVIVGALPGPTGTALTLTAHNAGRFDGTLHRADGLAVLELEPAAPADDGRFAALFRLAQRAVTPTNDPLDPDALCRRAADEVRSLTNFDRVAVYHFARGQNGRITAESSRDETATVPSPADLVAEVEGLCEATAARFIVDVDRALSPVEPVDGLDLSRFELRGASATDARHMRSVGARALLAVSPGTPGRAEVVIVGHHASPRYLDRATREACELVCRALAWQLAARAGVEAAERATAAHAALSRLNRELRATAEELRAASHAKDDFLAMVSHELRTPLHAMLGWLRILRGGAVAPERRAVAIETIERNARNQAQLVEDLLDVSRIIAGKLRLDAQPVDLAQVVAAAIESVRPAANARSIRLDPELDVASAPLVGDPMRLQQVAWNLLSNAIKFTPLGGRVRVTLARVPEHVELTVADTGVGIDPAALPHVFERFRQAESGSARAHQGLGLGLSIVRHLVELHGGTVTARSEGLGLGATFSVRLPLSAAHATESATPQALPESARASLDYPPQIRGMRALVIDDEHDATELLAEVLAPCGVTVRTVNSGAEALAAIERERPDVILSDIGMPGMDGYTLMRRIRALPAAAGGRTPAVALTAYARTEDRARAFLAGFDAHVPKPIEAPELFAVLAGLIARRSPEASVAPVGPAPSEPAPRSSSRPPTGEGVARALAGVRALAVEDDDDAREILAEALRAEGAEVRTAASASEAKEVFRAWRPDILVSDLGLPDQDGLALVRDLRAEGHERGGWIPAVALTGSVEAERQCLMAGYQLHVTKPVDPAELVARIAKLIKRSVGREG
jgi:signal transduction histidine kinase/DNA-binding response OmpR family regulator